MIGCVTISLWSGILKVDIILTTALHFLVENENMLRRHLNVNPEPWTTKKSEIRPVF